MRLTFGIGVEPRPGAEWVSHGVGIIAAMPDRRRAVTEAEPMPATSVAFAQAARALATEVRRRGLQAPSWRSPPRVSGSNRTLRRRHDGSVVVAVRVRGRPWLAVLADMIEGVVVANHLAGPAADDVRTALWGELTRGEGRSVDQPRRVVRGRTSPGRAPVGRGRHPPVAA